MKLEFKLKVEDFQPTCTERYIGHGLHLLVFMSVSLAGMSVGEYYMQEVQPQFLMLTGFMIFTVAHLLSDIAKAMHHNACWKRKVRDYVNQIVEIGKGEG